MKKLLIFLLMLISASACAQYNPLRPPPFLRIITDTGDVRKIFRFSNYARTSPPGDNEGWMNGDTLFLSQQIGTVMHVWKFRLGTTPISGQVLKWNGTVWLPGTDENTGGGGTSDTALFAWTAYPIGPAGGCFTDFFPAPNIAPNVITDAMIKSGQVVKSINLLRDHIIIKGLGGVSISSNGVDSIFINGADTTGGDSSGIITIQSGGTINITDPNGPTVNIDVADNAITKAKMADASVGTNELEDGGVLTQDLAATAKTSFSGYSDSTAKVIINGISAAQIQNNAVINSKIIADAITTSKILNGTILSEDVSANFQSPLAVYATTSGGAPPTGPGGGIFSGTFPSGLILNPNTINSAHIINQSIGAPDIDSTILFGASPVNYALLYWLVSSGDTNIGSTPFSYWLGDSGNVNGLYWMTNYMGQDAARLIRGTLSVSRFPLSGVTAGSYNWGTVDQYGRVTYAQNVAGGGTGGGSGLTYAIVDSFSNSATKDTVLIPGAKSYWWYNATSIMKSPDESWTSNDFLKVFADSGRAIVVKNGSGTNNSWYHLGVQTKELAMPTGVSVTALSTTSLRVAWVDPVHTSSNMAHTTDSLGISFRTTQYDSVFAVATNKRYKKMGVQADTITGLTSGTKYFICVFPWTNRNESDTAGTGNRDTCSTTGAGGGAFFNADSLMPGKLQLHIAGRFITGLSNNDTIPEGKIRDTSGYNHHPNYVTASNKSAYSRAWYIANAKNGQAGISFRNRTGAMDTVCFQANAVAESLSRTGDSPFTMIGVFKLVDSTATDGYNAHMDPFVFDHYSYASFHTFDLYVTSPVLFQSDRYVDATHYGLISAARGATRYWGNYHIYEIIHDGDNTKLFIDGDSLGTFAQNYDGLVINNYCIGANHYASSMDFAGYRWWAPMILTEHLVYTAAASYTDRNYYRQWLKYIYAIP